MRNKAFLRVLGYIVVPIVFAAVFLLVCLFGFRSLLENVDARFRSVWIQGSPEYSFEILTDTSELPEDGILKREETPLPKYGDMYGELECVTADIHVPLYFGDDDDILFDGAGTYAGGSLPGEGGIVLTGAHDDTFFKNLESLKTGDEITITTGYGIFTYEVTESRTAVVTDSTAYKTESGAETLIMYTCYPLGNDAPDREQRYYVYAVKTGGPQIGEESHEPEAQR